ncbi:MAG TPA: HDIG domain-containing protein [Prolixibacteraceae bacterium]|nr:HDIG domain-containing protein [Prolixibacteraceae bacterium]HOS01313.1 HDIG domain-containing protein [Prolixibacteraceae bacterium]HPL46433.1 HDIG domain-containing protein [Prolixibacteraceae bacterium]
MKTFRQKVADYSQIIYRVIVFVVAAILLHQILPSEPRFKYEYQLGAPWKHDNLVAPFDFAVLKSSSEIETEKKEITRNFAPYFIRDTMVASRMVSGLLTDLESLIPADYSRREEVTVNLTNAIDKIYSAGILTSSPQSISILTGKSDISQVTGNLVKKIPVSTLFSEKNAYNLFAAEVDGIREKYPGIAHYLSNLDPGKYIRSNLRYDENYTREELQQLEASVSGARGMIQEGEKIILEGEIIDDARFQVLESLKNSYEIRKGEGINSRLVSIGKMGLILVFLTLLFSYMYTYKNFILKDSRKLTFLIMFIVLVVFLAMVINSFEGLHIYMFPLAILPVVIRTFYDPRTAIFTLIVTSLLIGFYAPNNYEFVLLEVSAGMIAVFSLNKMHRRVHVVVASLLVALTYAVVFTVVTLIQEGTLANYNVRMLQWFAWSSILVLVVYPLIFIFEKLFGFVSDVTLIELSNTNQPLLRKLAEEAPGTLQHSLQIANLAEEVILKIGGNPFLVRAGALYHDIGKAAQPNFFIENQEIGMNPHDQMSYVKSAEIIIDHVRNGIRTAKKYRLPESIMEFIASHHGTSKAKYFYLKQQQENPAEALNEKDFAYPGPLPRSREAAVVMLVDGIEAASRSMKEKTYDNLKILIDNMIDQKMRERQLDNSELTFAELDKIKEILLRKLVNIYHVRIEYPQETK